MKWTQTSEHHTPPGQCPALHSSSSCASCQDPPLLWLWSTVQLALELGSSTTLQVVACNHFNLFKKLGDYHSTGSPHWFTSSFPCFPIFLFWGFFLCKAPQTASVQFSAQLCDIYSCSSSTCECHSPVVIGHTPAAWVLAENAAGSHLGRSTITVLLIFNQV